MPNNDPVLQSVAAYSNAPQDYVDHYAGHLLDRPLKFANQLTIPSRILDLGCGPGRDLQIFGEYGHQPIGLELNPDFIRIASQHGDVVAGDIRNIDSLFTSASFDAIWAQASLVHLSHEETFSVLKSLHRLLNPGGRFYSCVSASGDSGWRDENDGRRWYSTWPGHTFAEAVANAGFNLNEITDGPYIEVWATKE